MEFEKLQNIIAEVLGIDAEEITKEDFEFLLLGIKMAIAESE